MQNSHTKDLKKIRSGIILSIFLGFVVLALIGMTLVTYITLSNAGALHTANDYYNAVNIYSFPLIISGILFITNITKTIKDYFGEQRVQFPVENGTIEYLKCVPIITFFLRLRYKVEEIPEFTKEASYHDIIAITVSNYENKEMVSGKIIQKSGYSILQIHADEQELEFINNLPALNKIKFVYSEIGKNNYLVSIAFTNPAKYKQLSKLLDERNIKYDLLIDRLSRAKIAYIVNYSIILGMFLLLLILLISTK